MRRSAPFSSKIISRLVAAVICLGGAGGTWAQSRVPAYPGGGANPMAENAGQILLWCALLLGTALVLGVAFYILRKRLASMDEESSATAVNPLGFTLADLRQMHAEGQLSDEEFDFAKRKMVAKAKAGLDPETTAEGHEAQVVDLGDLTQSGEDIPGPPDKAAPSSEPSDDASADKNDDPGDEPAPPDEPPSSP